MERIENKVNSLSISQSWNGNSEADNKDNNKIRQMCKDEENYEEAVRRRAALAKQARLKEQALKEQEDKAKSIKGKHKK